MRNDGVHSADAPQMHPVDFPLFAKENNRDSLTEQNRWADVPVDSALKATVRRVTEKGRGE